jgi:hypothetical protein
MKTLLIVLAISLVVFIPVYFVRCNKEYYAGYNTVKDRLKKIEGIKVLELWGNEDVTLEDIYATIVLSNGDTLYFHNLLSSAFDSTKYIWLSRINEWEFHSTGCYGNVDYEIGFPAHYKAFRELNLKSVQEIIINIDTIKKIVNTIATHPKFDTMVNIDGDTFYYQKYDKWKVPETGELPLIECRD